MDRRNFMRTGAAVIAAAAGGSILSACSSGPVAAPAAGPTSGPLAGGTLRAAFVGGGATETLNHLKGPTSLDYVRARARHGALGAVDPTRPDGVRYDLLETIEVADDLSTYTLRLRRGLTFTDGSPLTIRDVVYSLNAPATLGALPFLMNAVRAFDLDNARVEDDLTAVLPARAPIADGRYILCQSNLVFREGTTAFTADMPTCGPFRMTGFDPGQGASFVRHDGYTAPADAAGPFLDGLELRSIADGEARANALTGGQLDYAADLPLTAARTVTADSRFRLTATELPFVNQLTFSMNITQAPFTDPRVVEAFKYGIDRQGIVDTVFFGRAIPGNDLPALGFPDYVQIEQRPFDPDRARRLLQEAGAQGVPVTLTTGPEIPGMVEAATVFAENLRDIGVNIVLDQLPPGQLYADFAANTRRQLVGGYNPPQPPLLSYQSLRAGGAPSAFGFHRPDIDALFATARSAADPVQRRVAHEQAVRALWADTNIIIPVFAPTMHGHTPAVQGVRYEPFANFANAAVR